MAIRQSRSLDAEQFEPSAAAAIIVADTVHAITTIELDSSSLQLSKPFLGRWATLISTTNWEKGKIISEWRRALEDSGAAAELYRDENWSQQVGGVTPQHVGRLRRVHERFGDQHLTFPKLYWSHFLAAIDWEDAEMWLEGASQSRWSVSQMRRTRWEAMGGDPTIEPRESDLVTAGDDDDHVPSSLDSKFDEKNGPGEIVAGPLYEGPDFGDEDNSLAGPSAGEADALPWENEKAAVLPESPFVKLPKVPVDIADALEQFKLASIRHRANGWTEVSKDNVVQVLDALRVFANQ